VASSRRGGTRAISIGVDLKSIGRVVRDLDAIDVKTRARIIKSGMRDWGRLVAKQVKRNVTWKATNTPRATIQKVKTYPKGASAKRIKRIWVGVGIKEGARSPGKEVVGRYGEFFPGWRAHFYEAGWSPWPKGRPTNFVMDPTGQKRAGNYRGTAGFAHARHPRLRAPREPLAQGETANQRDAPRLYHPFHRARGNEVPFGHPVLHRTLRA
jgi:hypothetical protein